MMDAHDLAHSPPSRTEKPGLLACAEEASRQGKALRLKLETLVGTTYHTVAIVSIFKRDDRWALVFEGVNPAFRAVEATFVHFLPSSSNNGGRLVVSGTIRDGRVAFNLVVSKYVGGQDYAHEADLALTSAYSQCSRRYIIFQGEHSEVVPCTLTTTV